MKQRIIALLLVLALAVSVGAVFALAEDPSVRAVDEEGMYIEGAEEGENIFVERENAGTVELDPDVLTSITFPQAGQRMRERNLNVLVLQESVDMLENFDYEDLKETLRKQLNQIARAQGIMAAGSMYIPEFGVSVPVEFDSYSYAQMDQAYDALREQFDAIKNGEMQEDNAGVIRQLKNLQNQIVMGGETLYLAIVDLEDQEASLQRQLTALNRTVEEMELRYKLGQISALQLSEVKTGRTALVSGLETLRMSIANCKAQLEMMLGAQQRGEIRLGGMPEVTAEQLAAMDVEKDLQQAKEQSYDLFTAAETLAEEKEDYQDAVLHNWHEKESLEYRNARHTWRSAQYTYNNTIQEFELRFRTLHAQVLDYQQILTASKVSLESEKQSFAASELKYQQGTISRNAYLTAKDELTAAEEKVQAAANDLFSAYNTYRWAVDHGILN